ncbi:hypothetical protein HPULCUR_003654 [Helicostylum pulchrum]|uniref:RRM domain-containing protein n=1 Tax=Helicostylum pulchrum TaxID=562976 RepID=A0ABP9XTZ4_9FUNG
MFPYPQFSNRIYVNPKFNGGAQVNQQQLLQQQQMAQQRQYMEMEAKRMALLQHQQQLLMHKSRAAELDKKRKETAEMMRKRKEMKETNGHDDSQVGEKRKADVDSAESDRDTKRALGQSPAGGISIKGAAAAAARGVYPVPSSLSPSPSRNIPYTPPHMKKPENNIKSRVGRTPDITSRLGRPEEKKEIALPSQAIPIVTGGKSNTLAINGFKDDIKEQDIKNMTKDIPGGAQDIKINQGNKSVIVVFPSIEAAVTFRRKFNRFVIIFL